MNIKIIKKLGLYIFIFLVVILIVNIILNQITKQKCTENFTVPSDMEGNISTIQNDSTIQDYEILEKGSNITGYVFYKRNKNGDLEPTKNPRIFSDEKINNYVYTKQYVNQDNPNPEVKKNYLMNIFFDYFDIIWDFNTNKFNLDFFDAIKDKYFYRDPLSNNYFISYQFFVTQLKKVNIFYPSDIQYYNDVKVLASMFTKKLNYSCFSMPIFDGDIEDWEDYTNYMFIVIYRYKPIYPSLDHLSSNCCSYSNSEAGQNKCNTSAKNSSSTTDNNSDVGEMRDRLSDMFTVITDTAKKNKLLSDIASKHNLSPIDSVLNGQKLLKSGFVFHLGEIKNIFSFFNTISIDNSGDMYINFIPEVNMTNTDCRGEVNNTAFINSLDNTFEKFELDFRNSMINNEGNNKELSVKLPRSVKGAKMTAENSMSYILGVPKKTNKKIFVEKSNIDMTGGVEQGKIYKNNSSISASTEDGLYQNEIGPNSFSVSINTKTDGTGNWVIGGDHSFVSTTKYYSKSLKDNKPVSKIPITFDKDKLIIGATPGNTSNSKIQITDEGQIIYYKNSSTSLVLFDIATFNLTMDDLVTNSCWQCNAKYKNSAFTGGGSILGINGGNNEYVTDTEGKIRFYFDALGSFHGEVNISRNSTNITQAYNKKIVEFIDKNSVNPIEIIDNLQNLSIYNFSGTSFTNIGALSFTYLHELYTIEPSTNEDVKTIVSGEPTDYLYNFFRNAFDDNWYVFNSDINTKNCNLWFKNSNVFKKEGDFNVSTLLKTPEDVNVQNTYKLESYNDADNVEKCLDKCYLNEDCYAISFNKTSTNNSCELWKKDGIYNSFTETSKFSNTRYDVYSKVCNNNEQSIFTDAGFQLNGGKYFSDQTLGVQYKETIMDSANEYMKGSPFTLTTKNKYIDTNDPKFDKLISAFVDRNKSNFIEQNINSSHPHTWYFILKKNNIGFNPKITRQINLDARVQYVIKEIIKKKSNIKIRFADQTNYINFYKELDNQIFHKILQPLLSELNDKQQQQVSNKVKNTQSASNVTSQTISRLNCTAPVLSKREKFTNIANNIDYSNLDYSNLEKYKKAQDIMMKKILFNVDDTKNINNSSDIDNLLNIVLFIILILLISFIIIHKSKIIDKC